MAFFLIHAATTITVADHKTLLHAWRTYGLSGQTLIRNFIVEKPLTEAQFRRLPSELCLKIHIPSDELAFLERMWRLDDTRNIAA